MPSSLRDLPLGLIFLASLLAIHGAWAIGRRLGSRTQGVDAGSVAAMEASILGLLALMIGFSFSVALNRFESRRDAVLKEANSIGTTALRARLLPAPHNADVNRLLTEYVQLRLLLLQGATGAANFAATLERSNAIQEALWQQAKALVKQDNAMVPTGIFIQTLNDMIDAQETRLTAARNTVPEIVTWTLYGLAIMGAGFNGYGRGLQGKSRHLPSWVTGTLFATVILMIQDLDRPGAGFIKVSQQPILDTAASISSFKD